MWNQMNCINYHACFQAVYDDDEDVDVVSLMRELSAADFRRSIDADVGRKHVTLS
jgi:hypothetical protein